MPPTAAAPAAAGDRSGRRPCRQYAEYALLADGERGALIGPHGNIVWMCAPRWDSDAVFSSLLGGTGGYAITPTDPYVWGGHYEPGTLIWRSRWVTHTGIIESREALAFPGQEHRAVILRRIIATDGDARVQAVTAPPRRVRSTPAHRPATRRGHLDRPHRKPAPALVRRRPAPGVGATATRGLVLELTVPAGQHHDLVLEISDQPLPDAAARPGRRLVRHRNRLGSSRSRVGRTVTPRRTRNIPTRCSAA